MDIRDLEFLIEKIEEAVEKNRADYARLVKDQGFTETDVNWLKNHVIPEMTGRLTGELLSIKTQLRKELERKKSKKFYQFWK